MTIKLGWVVAWGASSPCAMEYSVFGGYSEDAGSGQSAADGCGRAIEGRGVQ